MQATSEHNDLEMCGKFGMERDDAKTLILICGQHDIELRAALEGLGKIAVMAGTSILAAAEALGRALEHRVPVERPDLSAILAAQKPNRAERRRDDHRRRSMKQPTGMPWDRRR